MELQTTYVTDSVQLNINAKGDVKTKTKGSSKKGHTKKSTFFKPRRRKKKKSHEPPVQLAPICRAPHPNVEASQPDSPDMKLEQPIASARISCVGKFDSEEANDEKVIVPSAPQTLFRLLSRRSSSVDTSSNQQSAGKSRLPFSLGRLLSRSSSSAKEKTEQIEEDDDFFSESGGADVVGDQLNNTKKQESFFVSKLSLSGLFSKSKHYSTDEEVSDNNKKKRGSLKKSLSRLASFSRILSMNDEQVSPTVGDGVVQSDRVVNYRSSSSESQDDEANIEVPVERPRKKSLVQVFTKPKPKQSPLEKEARQLEEAIEKKITMIGYMDHIEHQEEVEISTKEKVDAAHWGVTSKYGVAAHDYDITKHAVTPVGSSRSAVQTCCVRMYSENEDDDTSSCRELR